MKFKISLAILILCFKFSSSLPPANTFFNLTKLKVFVQQNNATSTHRYSIKFDTNLTSPLYEDLSKHLTFYWAKNTDTMMWAFFEYSSDRINFFYNTKFIRIRTLYRSGKTNLSVFMIFFPIIEILKENFRCEVSEEWYGKFFIYQSDYHQYSHSFLQLRLPKNMTAYFSISRSFPQPFNVFHDDFEDFVNSCANYHAFHLCMILFISLTFISVFYFVISFTAIFRRIRSFYVAFRDRNRVIPFVNN